MVGSLASSVPSPSLRVLDETSIDSGATSESEPVMPMETSVVAALGLKVLVVSTHSVDPPEAIGPQDDPLQRKPDISLAQRRLNWQPMVQLEQGLEKTIDYFRKMMTNHTGNGGTT